MTGSLPRIADLTLDEKIGQMLCLGWQGEDCLAQVNDQARACITEMRAGGMIVMGRNVQVQTKPLPPVDVDAVRAMLTEMQSLAAIPLLIPTDQEGGRVARLRQSPFTDFPSAATIGRTNRPALAQAAARACGSELAGIGINMNFAPVADVNSNPANPVIGDRAFGSDPETVARFVVAQTKGYAEGGVLPCAKHFPGHGDTHLDSHLDLPTVDLGLEKLSARELVPFAAAIAANIPAIMTAHIRFPRLDGEGLPATLSRPILTDLLRDRMGFTGLVVTDCLEMKAVRDRWGTPRAAVMAAVAGADLLLICHTFERQRATFDALKDAVAAGELTLERVDEAVGRVLAAKARMLELTAIPPAPNHILHASIAERIGREAGLSDTDAATATEPTTLGADALA